MTQSGNFWIHHRTRGDFNVDLDDRIIMYASHFLSVGRAPIGKRLTGYGGTGFSGQVQQQNLIDCNSQNVGDRLLKCVH
jgi:hypothetical protein